MAKANSDTLFAGTWELIPELSLYEEGHPPRAGRYVIGIEGETASFDITWEDDAGKSHHIAFSGPMDGTAHPHGSGPLTVSHTKLDAIRLDSSTYLDDRETSYTHRKASNDGALLAVLQIHRHADRPGTRNVQIYRRTTK